MRRLVSRIFITARRHPTPFGSVALGIVLCFAYLTLPQTTPPPQPDSPVAQHYHATQMTHFRVSSGTLTITESERTVYHSDNDEITLFTVNIKQINNETQTFLVADKGQTAQQHNLIHLQGNVQVHRDDNVLLTDQLTLDQYLQQAHTDQPIRLQGDWGKLNGIGAILDTETFTILNQVAGQLEGI